MTVEPVSSDTPVKKPQQPPAAGFLPPKRLMRMAGVVVFGPFLSQLDTTIVNIALPTLSAELHAPLDTVQWVASGYLLALALMIPLCGWLVDNLGGKRVYIGIFTLFATASTLCSFAQTIEQLITCRVFQGMAGGLLAPMAQMMLARHAGPFLARTIAFMSTPVLLAPILGPSVAGAILHFGSWHWLFLMNLPLGILAIALALVLLPPDEKPTPRRLDWLGFVLVSPGLVLLLDGMHRFATSQSGGRLVACGELFLALCLLSAFAIRGWRMGANSLIDLRLFARRNFNASATTQFLAMANAHGGMMLMPLYLLTVRDLTPSVVAIVIAPMGIGMLFTRALVEKLINRFGPRHAAMAGGCLCLAATIPFAWPGIAMPVELIGVLLFIRGFGVGFINMPSVISAYAGLSRGEVTHAATAINIFQRLGGPVATMTLALVLSAAATAFPPALTAGAASATAASASLGLALSPVAFSIAFSVLCLFNVICIASASRIAKKI